MRGNVPVPDWRQFGRGQDVSVDRDDIHVPVSEVRRQRVRIRETGDTYELMGVATGPAALIAVLDVSLRAGRRNRGMQLVGFRVDQKGRLVGEAWVPKAGLEREEFLAYVRRVAIECDLFEYYLTGKARE